jgi:hypothetical protein
MLKLETLDDLQLLHTNLVPESNTLEYKASPAVENTDARKLEMSKDISAMANAEGGQFVYGMTEANNLPAGLDDGIDPAPFNGLWFEQVLQNISPIIVGLKIRQVQLASGRVATVIDVPKSRTVHQARDRRYYRRRNFRNDMMEDYEIREALNRSTTPDLYLRMRLAQTPTEIILTPNSPKSEPFGINATIGNRSAQPSFYTVIHLFADNRLEGSATGYQVGAPTQTTTGVPLNRWINKLGIPGHFPIFAETEFSILDDQWLLTMPADLIGTQQIFTIGYMITAPGFSGQRFGKLFLTDGVLTLVMDPVSL